MRSGDVRVRGVSAKSELSLQGSVRATTLATRLASAGHPLNTRCGRQGLCAGCTVHLAAGSFQPAHGQIMHAPADVKACAGDVVPNTGAIIDVPARSLARHRPQIVTSFKLGVAAAQQPIPDVVPGQADHGLAIDVGTTTVVVALVDLVTGNIVREASALNRQVEFGDDVVTRIQAAATQLAPLQRAVARETIAPLVRDACAAAAVAPRRIAAVTVAGNTTMLHLLTGSDPSGMGVAPFRPVFTAHRILTAADLGWTLLRERTPVHLLPGFSAFVGADLVAGAACTALLADAGPRLLLDIGTNGEIVLQHHGRLYVTATAAGPAFEGGRLSQGTRAVAGAVAHVAFSRRGFTPRLELIPGQRPAVGLCGSAYVDYLAEARRIGLLQGSGRFDDAIWAHLPPRHVESSGRARSVRLRASDPSTSISEADVAHLLQAKAAIAAGVDTLLRRVGLGAADVKKLYLAGGFGLHLNVRRAIGCGLLPGFRPTQVEVVGNTALGGAWLALVDRTVLPEMTRLSQRAEVVELNHEPGFEDAFIDHLMLP